MFNKRDLTNWRLSTPVAMLLLLAVCATIRGRPTPQHVIGGNTLQNRPIASTHPRIAVRQIRDAPVIEDRGLTIEETIGAVFGGGRHLCLRANPDAKNELYRMLDEYVEDMDHHSGIIAILSYIGDGEDAVRLKERLMGYKGILDRSIRCHAGVAVAILDALGVMSRRGIPEAGDFLNEMLEPEFWQNSFLWDEEAARRRSSIPNALESVVRVFAACAIAGRDDLPEIREAILRRVQNESDEIRQRVEWRVDLASARSYAAEVMQGEATVPTSKDYETLRYIYSLKESFMAGKKNLSESELRNRRNTLLDPNWMPNGRETGALCVQRCF